MAMPAVWSSLSPVMPSRILEAFSRATPPPGTMPSSTAARVAFRASSTRSFFSFTSTSVEPPTRTTATPPASLARRSCSFSLSYSEVVSSIWARICFTRASIAGFSPRPSTMVVSSLVIEIFLARPSISMVTFSSLMPRSSEITSAPVRMAMSSSMALRRSPKPGAFTAATRRPPRSLLTTRVARASPSTSSATISSGRPDCTTASSTGSRGCSEESFFSNSRMFGSSRTASILSALVTK